MNVFKEQKQIIIKNISSTAFINPFFIQNEFSSHS